MSYQVLARKWRPRTFNDMVGQEHVLRALINALDHDRLHHAYLFTGTRGVGKTTIARILAKSLNCEVGVSSVPCGQCSACNEIAENRFVDLIEVDAASRTKVEDTRELLENVQYAPTRGRYKVYLIDEVHMLSNHSFNALLKTLEEPPPHVKFLLATTDPQKLPVTILSRCLQFNLKNMTPELITGHLKVVLDKELIPFEETALWQISRAADGSMRDALSLADQAIAYGSGKIAETDVQEMLGTIDRVAVYEIVQALSAADAPILLAAVAQMAEHAPDYASALGDILSILHRIAIGQALPEAVDNSHGDRANILQLAQTLPPEDVQLFYQTALLGRRDLPLAPDPRAGFEMVLLRMLAFKPQGVTDVPTRKLTAGSPPASASTGAPDPEPEPAIKHEPASMDEGTSTVAVTTQSASMGIMATTTEVPVSRREVAEPVTKEPEVVPAIRELSVTDTKNTGQEYAEQAYAPLDTVGKDTSTEAPLVEVLATQKVARVNETVKETQVNTKNTAKKNINVFTLSEATPARWAEIYLALNIGGMLQSTVGNCELIAIKDTQLHFVLDQDNCSLYSADHQQRLADALSDYFSEKVNAVITPGVITAETPLQIAIREKEERRVAAVISIKADPIVQQLMEHFSAVLDERTVQPID